MKILFITHEYSNYVPDLLLHGLRKLMGPDVVDYPRKNCLYEGILGGIICPDDQRFPGWFPGDNGQIDRTDIWAKAATGYFDYVLCDIRAIPLLKNQLDNWPGHCVIIDGEDMPQLQVKPGPYVVCRRETDGSGYSIPLPMALPEELLRWISRYDNLSKTYTIGFLGSTHDGRRRQFIETLASHYPDTLFQVTALPSMQSPQPQGRLGRDQYYQKLQQCRIVLTLAGAGYDTFRFWENAACNAVHVSPRFPLFIPNDFYHGIEIVRFYNFDDLRPILDGILEKSEICSSLISQGRKKLVDSHLTTQRAVYFLDRIMGAFGHLRVKNAAL
ncbi:MAG: glycosyltransferase family 1 protein [Desulfobacteraceae bacterium]|nr:glycosyltransferase family 1 protein [Desulfobacteraceae bacterium]